MRLSNLIALLHSESDVFEIRPSHANCRKGRKGRNKNTKGPILSKKREQRSGDTSLRAIDANLLRIHRIKSNDSADDSKALEALGSIRRRAEVSGSLAPSRWKGRNLWMGRVARNCGGLTHVRDHRRRPIGSQTRNRDIDNDDNVALI
jgi:hypothetical protein